MADLSKLTDEELQALLQQTPAATPVAPQSAAPHAPQPGPPQPSATPSLEGVSDEELTRLQAQANPKPTYSGGILPFSVGPDGKGYFDSNAGIIGSLKRAFTLPGDVYSGKVDPNSEEGLSRSLEMAATVTPANPAIRAGDKLIPGVGKNMVPGKAPTAKALEEAADAGYDQLRNLGVDYSAKSVDQLARGLQANLERDGILAELAPKTHAILQKLQNPPDGAVASIMGLEAARRALRLAAKDFANPTEQLASSRLIDGLDGFIAKNDASSVVAGPAAAAARIAEEARGNYAAAQRSNRLAGIEDTAELRSAAANSGQNLDNSLRQRVVDVLVNPQKRAGFSEKELGQLEDVVRGTSTGNAARYVGNLFGGGGGMGAMVAGGIGGYMTGSPGFSLATAAVPATGYAAKQVANRITSGGLKAVDEATRARSPLAASVPSEVGSTAGQQAIIRAIILAEQARRRGEIQ